MQNSDIMLKMSGLGDLLQCHEPCAKSAWANGCHQQTNSCWHV